MCAKDLTLKTAESQSDLMQAALSSSRTEAVVAFVIALVVVGALLEEEVESMSGFEAKYHLSAPGTATP